MKICLTGGIACGKSLLSHYLNELGIETCDADDIVHELIPADERKRLAATVFRDPVQRRALESRIHPLVRERITDFLNGEKDVLRLAVIPLLFEVHWESEYDIIVCIASQRSTQIERMMVTRGYTREEAELRLAAQMDVTVKTQKSNYVIWNDGTPAELREEAVRFVAWLKKERNNERRT